MPLERSQDGSFTEVGAFAPMHVSLEMNSYCYSLHLSHNLQNRFIYLAFVFSIFPVCLLYISSSPCLDWLSCLDWTWCYGCQGNDHDWPICPSEPHCALEPKNLIRSSIQPIVCFNIPGSRQSWILTYWWWTCWWWWQVVGGGEGIVHRWMPGEQAYQKGVRLFLPLLFLLVHCFLRHLFITVLIIIISSPYLNFLKSCSI